VSDAGPVQPAEGTDSLKCLFINRCQASIIQALKILDFSQAGTSRISPDVLKLDKTASFNNAGKDGLGLCVLCVLVAVLCLRFCDLTS